MEKIENILRKIPLWGWYVIWFAIITFLYYPSIIILPKRDHAIFMMGRDIVENDWKWFLDILSYNRTRFLQPGDYFAFRPVHLAILGIWDILLRTKFVLQGVVDCAVMALAATMFTNLAKRLTTLSAAAAITMLWFSQLGGVEIVMWQHITPYLIAPSALFFAITIIIGDKWGKKEQLLSTAAMLTACLTHELCIMISLAISIIVMFDNNSKFRKPVLEVFLSAAVISLLLNGIDYLFIHPPPSMMGPSDKISINLSPLSILSELSPLAGAIISAFFRPDSVNILLTDEFSFLWLFTRDISANTLFFNSIFFYFFLILTTALLGWQLYKQRGFTAKTFTGTVFLLFLGATFAITSFRVLTRGIGYMFGAGYYFSLFSLALCCIIIYLISNIKKHQLVNTTALIAIILSLWHAKMLRKTVSESTETKKMYASQISEIRETFSKNSNLCFAGMDPFTLPEHLRAWMPLFKEFACQVERDRQPLYVAENEAGLLLIERKFILSRTDRDLLPQLKFERQESPNRAQEITTPIILFGYPIDITYRSKSPFLFEFITQNDTSYSFSPHYNELLMMEKNTFNNTIAKNIADGKDNHIQIQFNKNDMFIFINNTIITTIPRPMTQTGTLCYMKLKPKLPGLPFELKKISIASKPGEIAQIQ